jgi:hypothetical protein
MAALRRAVARALRHHADEAGRRGVVRAPAAALGPPPRLRAPGNRVAGALADVAGLGGAVGEVVVDVAGPRLVAEAALAARPGVGKAAAVALVGDAGVVVVAVDVDAAKAEAVAVAVAVDAGVVGCSEVSTRSEAPSWMPRSSVASMPVGASKAMVTDASSKPTSEPPPPQPTRASSAATRIAVGVHRTFIKLPAPPT